MMLKFQAAALFIVALGVPPAVHAQVMLSPAFEEKKPEKKTLTADSITIHGTILPDPPLRHRLWPAPENRRWRNGMTVVNRAIILTGQVPQKERNEFQEWHHALNEVPLAEFPVDEAKDRLSSFALVLAELKRCENWMDHSYDLGLDGMTTSEVIATWLPEYQEMRYLARMLSLRARIAASEERWEEAFADLRLGFRLAEIASHSTDLLISRVIGIAIAGHMMDTIETLIEHPACPSLYWALASLPVDRIFEMREAIEFESAMASHVGALVGRSELPDEIIGEEEALVRIKETAKSIDEMIEAYGDERYKLPLLELSTGVYVAMSVEPSRRLLAESSAWKGRVDDLSDAEVVLRATDLELRRIRDRWLTWSLLPPNTWDDYRAQREEAFSASRQSQTAGAIVAHMLQPATERASRMGYNAIQRHHRLLTIEAIRLYVQEHHRLPENLDKLLPVPVWPDPISHKPFGYVRLSDEQAILQRASHDSNDSELTLEIKLETRR